MDNVWERARARYAQTPVPEELSFAVASAIRTGSRRRRAGRGLRRGLTGGLAACACFVLLVNANPTFARAVSDVPVLGGLARVFTVSEYTIDEREQLIDVRMPALELPESTDLEQRINTETRASAYTEVYTYNIDLEAGRELTLRDMLGPDYVELANAAVREGIAAREAADPDATFFHDEAGFTSIDEDQAFYINEAGNPVVLFEKYELAPGYMGQPEFEVPVP